MTNLQETIECDDCGKLIDRDTYDATCGRCAECDAEYEDGYAELEFMNEIAACE